MSSTDISRRQIVGTAVALTAAAAAASPAEAAEGGRLTVHILDLFSGVPASGVAVELFRRDGTAMAPVKTVTTQESGRPAAPLLAGADFTTGRYQLAFDLSSYFKGVDRSLPPSFFRKIVLEFEVVDASQPHHVPLQCTPWTQACSVLPG